VSDFLSRRPALLLAHDEHIPTVDRVPALRTSELGWVTIARPADLRRAPSTVGRPLRNTIVRALDEDGIPLRAGQTGRIFVANTTSREHRTGDAIEASDRLIATGDVGHLDDHERLFIDGGEDEELLSGTKNIDQPRTNQSKVLR